MPCCVPKQRPGAAPPRDTPQTGVSISDPVHAQLQFTHDRITFVLPDWTRPLLSWALGAAGLGAVMLVWMPEVDAALHCLGLAAFSAGGYLLGPRRQVHITAQHLELVESGRLGLGRVLRWPLQEVTSLALVVGKGTTALHLDLPDRRLALLAQPEDLARAATMIRAVREDSERRDRGSEQDIPDPLRQIAHQTRERAD
jgi:hypothetical protein